MAIPLPTLDIQRDELQEAQLLVLARAWLEREERALGIHASDLLDLRKAYWRYADPKPITERQVWLFLIGKVLHHFVLESVKPGQPAQASDSGTRQELGIRYSPDIRRDEGYPTELKTNRAGNAPEAQELQAEYPHYLEQLCIYMVLENVLQGSLWILYISLRADGGRTYPEPRCYRVVLTEAQFHQIEQRIIEARDRLQDAMDRRTHRDLPLCRAWLCGKGCEWFEACRPPNRWPETDRRKWRA